MFIYFTLKKKKPSNLNLIISKHDWKVSWAVILTTVKTRFCIGRGSILFTWVFAEFHLSLSTWVIQMRDDEAWIKEVAAKLDKIKLNAIQKGFPGGSVVKNPPAGGAGLIPG